MQVQKNHLRKLLHGFNDVYQVRRAVVERDIFFCL